MEVSVSKRRHAIKKDLYDYVSLPDSYPLPKLLQADVKMSLNKGKMTNRKFISAIVSSILAYKKYHSSEDYVNVG